MFSTLDHMVTIKTAYTLIFAAVMVLLLVSMAAKACAWIVHVSVLRPASGIVLCVDVCLCVKVVMAEICAWLCYAF